MTYPEPQAPAARQRPAVVTASSGLLVLLTVLMVISAIVGFVATNDKVKQAMKDAFKDTPNGESAQKVTEAIQSASIALTLVFAVAVVVLALLNLRGKRVSRILTWVFGGIALLCCSCGILGQVAGGGGFGADETQKAAQQKIQDAYPSWYQGTSTALLVIELLCLIAALVLLALPAANDFFRKPKPDAQWVPPTEQF